MNRFARHLRRQSPRRGVVGALGVLLVGGGVAFALLGSPERGSREAVERLPFDLTPVGDDVPDAAPPKGTVRPSSTGGTAPPTAVFVVADRLLVKFEEGTANAVARDVLADVGGDPEGTVPAIGTKVVEISPKAHEEALAELRADPAVEYAESDVVLQAVGTVPNDSRWSAQWGPRRIAAPDAWSVTRGSSSVVIAVLDTGVAAGHRDLKGAVVAGYDFVNDDSGTRDDHGHGTAAAGVAAARTNNTSGIAGTCWKCAIMPVKVLDANGSGSTSTVAQGIVWATDHGASVINLSLGSPGSTQTLADAVDYATSRDVVVVAAAGNSGSKERFYPAAYRRVVSVAGSKSSDRRYTWSNHGSWVHVAAPGCNLAPLRGGGYGTFCGTSSATPVVAGLVGLERALDPSATRSEVVRALRKSAVSVGNYVASGRISAKRALRKLGAS